MSTGSVSLKSRLLTWLLIPLTLMAIALVAESYFSSKKSIEDIHDRMMVALAWSISENVLENDGDMLSEQALDILSLSSNEKLFYQVLGPKNSFITGHAELPEPPTDKQLKGGTPYFYDATFDGDPVRMLSMRFLVEGRIINGWVQIRVAQTLSERKELLKKAVIQSTIRILTVVVLASLLAVIGVNRGLDPLTRLQSAIQKRSYNDLRPINPDIPQEIEKVVSELNNLLFRLEDSIDNQRRFISNASHQLRTPLAALQAETELALREIKDPKSLIALSDILKATKQTSRLAQQLLSLTRVRGNPKGGMSQTEFNLVQVSKEVTLNWVKRALAKGKDLGFETDLEEATLSGSEVQIREMLSNLIDNAINYGGDIISVRLRRVGKKVALEVEDDGPGIPEKLRGQVFERFVRLDERAGEGCGLGLDIVREIAVGHDGTIELLDGKDKHGLLVCVLFS
ncbi:MAG: sensor histidine kinase [Methylocystaceae bacterium]|nr:sensor histidine kinase [Methylocystaceae bacterium]